MQSLKRLWRRLRFKPITWYALQHLGSGQWFTGGDVSFEFGDAQWYDEPEEVRLACAYYLDRIQREESPFYEDRSIYNWRLMRMQTQFGTNHFKLKEMPWD
jgi:hypothetical protein